MRTTVSVSLPALFYVTPKLTFAADRLAEAEDLDSAVLEQLAFGF